MIDGDLLASFVAFGETRNLTRAARAIGLSQPALFERLRRLADAVGQPLYERRGRELALTEAGTRVLAFATDERARHGALLAELHGAAPRQQVVLAAGEGAYLYVLGPAIARFAREGAAELQLLTLGARATVEALRTARADLGVAAIDLIPRGIDARPLVTTPLCIALPARHPAAKLRAPTLEALRGARWILPPEGQLHRDLVTRAIARTGESPSSVIEADGWPLMLHFVALGLGVAIVNGTCPAPRGAVVRPLRELGTITYRLLRRHGATPSPGARALAECLVSALR